jgi:hypothetical protein
MIALPEIFFDKDMNTLDEHICLTQRALVRR